MFVRIAAVNTLKRLSTEIIQIIIARAKNVEKLFWWEL